MKSLDDFFKDINHRLRTGKFKDCSMPLFRGHSDGAFELLPTLQRSCNVTKKEIWTLENNLYCDFRSMVGPRVNFRSSWDALFAMRHEGIPTRLLDWTESIGTALFFALNSSATKRPHIWVLNPYKLNEHEKIAKGMLVNPEEDLKDYQKSYACYCYEPDPTLHTLPIAVYPNRTNERILAQKGWFTIHGIDDRRMEDNCIDSLEKIDVPVRLITKLRSLIKHFGINSYTVYPDFKGLCEHLKETYSY